MLYVFLYSRAIVRVCDETLGIIWEGFEFSLTSYGLVERADAMMNSTWVALTSIK